MSPLPPTLIFLWSRVLNQILSSKESLYILLLLHHLTPKLQLSLLSWWHLPSDYCHFHCPSQGILVQSVDFYIPNLYLVPNNLFFYALINLVLFLMTSGVHKSYSGSSMIEFSFAYTSTIFVYFSSFSGIQDLVESVHSTFKFHPAVVFFF